MQTNSNPADTNDDWQLSPEIEDQDPLLSCLALISHYFNRPYSEQVLKAGLPDAGKKLTPSLFLRSAEKAGFKTKVIKKSLRKLSSLLLPVVLPLEQGKACILTRWLDQDTAEIVLPETGGTQPIPIKELESYYLGYSILIRPEHEVSPSQDQFLHQQQRHWFWQVLYRDWWIYAQVVLAAILVNTFALTTPLFIMTVYDRVIPHHSEETLWVLAFGAVTVFVFDFIIRGLRGYFVDVAGRRIDVLLASRVFDQVLNLQMQVKPNSSGAFANTLQELASLRDFFTSASLMSLVDFPFIVFFITIFWLVGGPMVIILLIAIPIVFIISVLLQLPLNQAVRKAYRYNEQKQSVLIESLMGLETIKSIGAEARIRHQWEHNVAGQAYAGQHSRFWSLNLLNFTMLSQQLTLIAVVVYGVYLVHEGILSFGMLIACVMLSSRAMVPIAQVAQTLLRMHHAMAAFQSLNHIMKLPVERPQQKKFLHRPQLDGNIEFHKVSFRYSEQNLNVIEQLQLKIKAGEKVGIIGRIGSGKTTLQKLLLALYRPTEGTILLDNIDIQQIDPIDLRRAIAYVPQDIFLFRGTVKENITVSHPSASDAEILQAAKLAGVDDFVSQHPLGYDLPVGERGETLSGGQRQAIILARALIQQPNILLLDEPTNAMDSRSEDQFKTRMQRIFKQQQITLVLVTHRASLLTLVDRLLVLDRGKIVADGPRQAVLDAIAKGQVKVAE